MKNKQAKIDSIKSKLKNRAINNERDYGEVLRNYLMQQLLYKIERTKYKENFVLKGGYLLHLTFNKAYPRATYDLDFLGQKMPNTCGHLYEVFYEILSDVKPDDVITYDLESLRVDIINKRKTYTGVRVRVTSFLGKSRETLIVDVSFGDVISDSPNSLKLVDNLSISEDTTFLVYPLESVIAEKLEAIVVLEDTNGRLKDFYDIHQILTRSPLSTEKLKQAINQTFRNRNTPLNFSILKDNNFIFGQEIESKWNLMKKRAKLKDTLSFPKCVEEISGKILPLFYNLCFIISTSNV